MSGKFDLIDRLTKTIMFFETEEKKELKIGYIKGVPSDDQDITLHVAVTNGSASVLIMVMLIIMYTYTVIFLPQDNNSDFRVEKDEIRFEGNKHAVIIPVAIVKDEVAREAKENFTLTLEVISDIYNDLIGNSVFLLETLQVHIVDNTSECAIQLFLVLII